MDNESWVVVHNACGMVNASIVTGRLEVEGIPFRLKYDVAGTIYAITLNGLGEVKIEVPAGDADRARAILSKSYEDCLPDE
ncbi:MAG: DUF2007 domain-containing protein [Syntrophales bacterium]